MGSSTTQTQEASPWGPAAQPLEQGIGDLTNMYQSGGLNISPFPGNWVPDMSSTSQQGINAIQSGAQAMQGGLDGAINTVGSMTAPGAWDAQRKNVIDQIMPAINGSFAGSGMTGSTLHQQNLAQGLSSGLASAEQGFNAQQMQAAGMMPGLLDATLNPGRAMMGAGQYQDEYAGRQREGEIQQFMLDQGSEAAALRDYLTILSTVGGQFGSQAGTQTQNPGLLGILGGGLQAASMF